MIWRIVSERAAGSDERDAKRPRGDEREAGREGTIRSERDEAVGSRRKKKPFIVAGHGRLWPPASGPPLLPSASAASPVPRTSGSTLLHTRTLNMSSPSPESPSSSCSWRFSSRRGTTRVRVAGSASTVPGSSKIWNRKSRWRRRRRRSKLSLRCSSMRFVCGCTTSSSKRDLTCCMPLTTSCRSPRPLTLLVPKKYHCPPLQRKFFRVSAISASVIVEGDENSTAGDCLEYNHFVFGISNRRWPSTRRRIYVDELPGIESHGHRS